MPREKDDLPAVRVYTVCDESRYLIVRNLPALGCGDDLLNLLSTHGHVEECKPMDAEDCDPYTDVYWVQFSLVTNARFAKRKLDEYVFMGNRLQVSYAPQFETLDDTKQKLEGRRKEVIARLNPQRSKGPPVHSPAVSNDMPFVACPRNNPPQIKPNQGHSAEQASISRVSNAPMPKVSSDKDYFESQSMNETVQMVRNKMNKIQTPSEHLQAGPAAKKARPDNRRRI